MIFIEFPKKLRTQNFFNRAFFIIWAHSLTDRITGFGPVDGGSIPPVLIEIKIKYGSNPWISFDHSWAGEAERLCERNLTKK